ncbi:proteasome alpha subunit-like protein, partial [Leptotrombidium deliense]
GLLADSKAIVNLARDEARDYRSKYGAPIPLKYLKDRVAQYMHAYTLYSALRPFGTSLLLGTWDQFDGPQLYCLDPSGLSVGYFGCTVGKAKQAAKTEIEKITNLKDRTCEELVKEAAKVIYVVHDEIKDKAFELELSWITEATNGRHEIVPEKVFKEAETFAKEAMKHDSDSD